VVFLRWFENLSALKVEHTGSPGALNRALGAIPKFNWLIKFFTFKKRIFDLCVEIYQYTCKEVVKFLLGALS